MPYKVDDRYVGASPIESVTPVPASLAALPVSPGFVLQAEDSVWGTGTFVFARAGGAIRLFGLCVLTPVWDSATRTYIMNATEVPATANLGRSLYVYQGGAALTVGQYGWFMKAGITPVNCNASVAADTTFGIAAAGQGGANVAGRQILGGRVVTAATNTVVKPSLGGAAGSRVIQVSNTEGWFVGGFLSGTGIAGGTTIVSIDALGRSVGVSADLTAEVTGNVTMTANNGTIFYNVAMLENPIAQGAIT